MLVGIVRAHGKKVFTNPSTANILQGFYSTIIEKADALGRIRADVAILEMDEGHAELLTRSLSPRQVTVMNVMEDQIDRFVDPELVRQTLAKVAARATSNVILNADDQNTVLMADSNQSATVTWFGVSQQLLEEEKHGLATAPTFLPQEPRPTPRIEASSRQGLTVTAIDSKYGQLEFSLPNRGLHFILDAVAALESARAYLLDDFQPELAEQVLNNLPPVFARGEVTEVNGEPVEFVLVQNPGSMQLNLDNLSADIRQVFFAIGRDVHDPSWLWTVNFENLKHVDVVSGYNAFEAALALEYNDVEVRSVEDDLDAAIAKFFALPLPAEGIKTVIFSADAMRRLRRSMGFWSPEEVER
jgi:UDP-N-acetylmuramyl tripeptide synthase